MILKILNIKSLKALQHENHLTFLVLVTATQGQHFLIDPDCIQVM